MDEVKASYERRHLRSGKGDSIQKVVHGEHVFAGFNRVGSIELEEAVGTKSVEFFLLRWV